MSTPRERLADAVAANSLPAGIAQDVAALLQDGGLHIRRDYLADRWSNVSIRNDLRIPEDSRLTVHSEVRFQTGSLPADYVDARMPTSRDQGWIEFTPGPFSHLVTALRGGTLQMRAVRYDHDYTRSPE